MSINLVLKSSDSITYAGGKASFVVKWSQFLTEHQQYKVSFSFITAVDANLNQDDLYVLSLDNIGTTLKNIQGGNYNSSTSREIGFIYSEEPHSSHARLRAEFLSNPPVDMVGRANQDLLEISFKDITGTLMAKTPPFVLFLRFEAI